MRDFHVGAILRFSKAYTFARASSRSRNGNTPFAGESMGNCGNCQLDCPSHALSTQGWLLQLALVLSEMPSMFQTELGVLWRTWVSVIRFRCWCTSKSNGLPTLLVPSGCAFVGNSHFKSLVSWSMAIQPCSKHTTCVLLPQQKVKKHTLCFLSWSSSELVCFSVTCTHSASLGGLRCIMASCMCHKSPSLVCKGLGQTAGLPAVELKLTVSRAHFCLIQEHLWRVRQLCFWPFTKTPSATAATLRRTRHALDVRVEAPTLREENVTNDHDHSLQCSCLKKTEGRTGREAKIHRKD